MQVCFDIGIPHSEFLEWSGPDRAKALSFAMERNTRCQMCGTADWEWEEDPHAYVPIEQVCWGCYHKEGARLDKHSDMPGTRTTLVTSAQAEKIASTPAVRPTRR
jgi:hypothetical protein